MLEWLKKKNSEDSVNFAIGHSIAISLCFMTIMLLMGPSYETNDDWSISWQLSNSVKGISTFLPPYLSLILSTLYNWFPTLPWWSLLSFFTGGILLFILTYMTIKRHHGILRYVFLFLWFIIIWIVFIKNMNFTRTAVALSLGGGLLLFQSLSENKKYKKLILAEIIFGLLLFAIGFMVRFQAAFISVPFIVLAFCYRGFYLHSEKHEIKAYFYHSLVRVLLMIVIVAVVHITTIMTWNNYPDWKDYQEYNTARSLVQDYAGNYPSWDEEKNAYQRLGFEEGDEEMLLFNWFTEDTAVYSKDILQQMSNLYERDINTIQMIKNLIKMTIVNHIFWIAIFLLIFLLFIIKKKKLWLLILANLCGAAVIILYFTISGRIVLRVYEPILLCVIVNLFLAIKINVEAYSSKFLKKDGYYFTIDKSVKKDDEYALTRLVTIPIRKTIIITFCVVLFVPIVGHSISNIHLPSSFDGADSLVRTRMDYFDDNRDKVYLIPTLSDDWSRSYGIWDAVPTNYCPNLFYLGGWMARTPTNVDKLANLGIQNPAESLVFNDNVYSLNDSDIFDFLKRHYGKNITCTQVGAFPGAGGPVIVKYTSPHIMDKKDEIIADYSGSIGFQFLPQFDLWHLKVINKRDFRNLYCNVTVDGETYTYFLENYEKNKYEGYFFEFSSLIKDDIDSIYLLGKTEDGQVTYLGSIYDTVFDESRILIDE